jgi:hypothetical protein
MISLSFCLLLRVQVNPKGSIPSSVLSLGCYGQAEMLSRLRGALEKDQGKGLVSVPTEYRGVSYEGKWVEIVVIVCCIWCGVMFCGDEMG